MELVAEIGLQVVGELVVALAVSAASDSSSSSSSRSCSTSTSCSSSSSYSSSRPSTPRPRSMSSPSSSSMLEPKPKPKKPVPPSLKSGYFIKEGHFWKTWKKRWFALRCTTISYYESNSEEKLLGEIEIKGAHIHAATRPTNSYYGDRECLVIETPSFKTFYMFPNCKTRVAAERTVRDWLEILEVQGALVVQAPPTSKQQEEQLSIGEDEKKEKPKSFESDDILPEVEPMPPAVFNDYTQACYQTNEKDPIIS